MSNAVHKPLVIREENSKDIDIQEAGKRLGKFLSTEIGIQSAPTGVAQQLQQLLSGIDSIKASTSGSDDSDNSD